MYSQFKIYLILISILFIGNYFCISQEYEENKSHFVECNNYKNKKDYYNATRCIEEYLMLLENEADSISLAEKIKAYMFIIDLEFEKSNMEKMKRYLNTLNKLSKVASVPNPHQQEISNYISNINLKLIDKLTEIRVTEPDTAIKQTQDYRSYNIFIFVLVFLLFSMLFAAWLFYNRYNALKKRSKLESELSKFKMLAFSQQLNPHFMFNTLSSIQYYIAENESIKAEEYLEKFSKLMRMILENSYKEKIYVDKEIETLSIYLELESLRFKNQFNYEFKIDNKILECQIPPFLLQPFIENSIWHGFQNKEGGIITLEMTDCGEIIMCRIVDNGIGREKAKILKQKKGLKHKSRGIEIIKKRLDALNSLYGEDLSIKYMDLKNDVGSALGTEVCMTIPKL